MSETIAPAGPPTDGQPLERPIETEAQDRFGRAAFVHRIATGLIGRDGMKARGVVVGVVGAWGSGKSSVLNLLAADLAQREPKPVVVRFDPWLISGRDDLVLALLAEMHAAIAAAPGLKEKAGQFLDTASPYISVLGRLGGAFVPGLSDIVDKGVDAVRERMKGPSGLQQLKSAVARTLHDVPAPVVVLIDELDRLRDDEVRTVAQLVRAVADFPHVSYVLAYDQRRVEEALGSDLPGDATERRERGRAYLEKLVHIPIPLPVAVAGEVRELLFGEVRAVFAENALPATALSGERGDRLFSMLSEEVLDTPREVLRATGVFRVMAGMVREEVDLLDLLALSVLQTRFPDLYQTIRDKPDLFVPNLFTMRGAALWSESMEEKDTSARLAKRFPGISISDSGRALVLFLFPDLSSRDDRLDDDADGNTIRNRRAFVTALRLGLPPGTVSRSETERLFHESEENALASLKASLQADKLADVLDRSLEVYPLMDAPTGGFWPAAAQLCRRSRATWEPRYSPFRGQTEAIAKLANARLRKRPDEREKFAALAGTLGALRDPHILPFWFQWHALGFGLYGLPTREDRASLTFLNQAELGDALKKQADWVVREFCDGDLLFELHHGLVLHQLLYVDRWDERCRQKMEFLLRQQDGLDQFALLFFGGHFLTEQSVLRRFIDFDIYSSLASDRIAYIEHNGGDPTLSSSLKKSIGRDY